MDHIAILRKSKVTKGDDLLGAIIAGQKTIESRWYVNKIAPWNKVHAGDTIYFKESGCPVTAKANVSEVLQFENLSEKIVAEIISKYGKQIAPQSSKKDFSEWGKTQSTKRYCILVFLSNVAKVEPFTINKQGFGIACAWMIVKDVSSVRL